MSDGQRAFEAYGAATGGVTWDGRPIPAWEELTDPIRTAWDAAADAVLEPYRGEDSL